MVFGSKWSILALENFPCGGGGKLLRFLKVLFVATLGDLDDASDRLSTSLTRSLQHNKHAAAILLRTLSWSAISSFLKP